MSRFLAWFKWEWRDHAKLVLGCALASVFIAWVALLLGKSNMGRAELEAVFVTTLGLMAVVLAAGLFGSERRHGAESLILRTPRAHKLVFVARLAFYVTALCVVGVVASFGSAQLAHMEAGEGHRPYVYGLGSVVWPRWLIAEFLVLVLGYGAVTIVVSMWTRRVALAFLLGLLLPAVVLFPWVRLGAARGDFYPFWRLGAVSMAAWPLLLLALLALTATWFLGRRVMNRPWRPAASGLSVLAVGMALAGGWTALAFSAFDRLDPAQAGFRLSPYPVEAAFFEFGTVRRGRYGYQPFGTVALAPQGRWLWVHGYRRDAGAWPEGSLAAYGAGARDFRENRGTWSKQCRIDLDSGDLRVVGDVRDRITWSDLGSGDLSGRLHGVDPGAYLAPRGAALFGRPGRARQARMLDLRSGRFVGGEVGTWSEADLASRARRMRADTTAARDEQGRPAWMVFEHPVRTGPGPHAGNPRVFIETPDGRLEVTDTTVRSMSNVYADAWTPIRGGWARDTGYRPPRLVTLDTTGRVRKSTREQLRRARLEGVRWVVFLDPRHAVTPAWRDDDALPTAWVLLDLETGEVGPPKPGPRLLSELLVRPVQSDGRMLALLADPTTAGPRLALWDARTGDAQTLDVPADPWYLAGKSMLSLVGADARGNAVVRIIRFREPLEAPAQPISGLLLYFHAASHGLHVLDEKRARPPWGLEPAAVYPVGIDAKDRLVYLLREDGGYRKVVRFDPADDSKTVLFPKAERGPLPQ